jgi:hypothetical protein
MTKQKIRHGRILTGERQVFFHKDDMNARSVRASGLGYTLVETRPAICNVLVPVVLDVRRETVEIVLEISAGLQISFRNSLSRYLIGNRGSRWIGR